MSLQHISSLPPNKIIDEREKGDNTGSRKWLEQLTETAVEKAFKLQAESGRLVDVVDTQSCGGTRGFGCSNPLFSPLSSKLLKNPSFITTLPSRNWALSKESEDRCCVAAKIYALLVQWRSDFSFEWRARVASAVPVLEEALYQEAKSREDYTNQLLLESQLKHVLMHFEAGNGLFLLQGTSPLYPVSAYQPSANTGLICNDTTSMGQNVLSQDGSVSAESHEIAPDEALEWGTADLPCTEDSISGLCRRTEANCALWDAVVSDQTTSMEAGLHKPGDHASKKIVSKVINMLSKKRRDDNRQLKQELRSAGHGAENIARLFMKAEMKSAGGGSDVKHNSESCSPLQTKLESPCNEDVRTRKRSGKTLGDMLRLNLLNEPAFGGSLVITVEAAPPILPMNRESQSIVVCCLESDEMSPCCILNSESMEVETQSPSSPLSSGSQVAHNEDSSVSSAEEVLASSDLAKYPTVQEGLGEISACSSVPSPSSSSTLLLPASTSPSASSLPQQLPPLSSSSPLLAAPLQHLSPPRSLTSPSPLPQHVLPPSPLPQHVLPPSPPLQKLAPPSPLAASSMPLHHLRPSSSSSLPEEEQDQEQQPLTSTYMLQLQTLVSCQDAEAQVPVPTSAAESQQTEAAETSSSAASDDTSLQPRERGLRVPLSSFLAQRDDYNLNNMVPISCYEPGPWDTWEEPTEQLDPLCCVCMVGLKGAAFIPCGHAFCRKCSRELWRGRGTCPLCNRYIREILDIY